VPFAEPRPDAQPIDERQNLDSNARAPLLHFFTVSFSMDPEMATTVAVGIAAVGFVIWLFALQMMLRATRERRALSDDDHAQAFRAENAPGTIAGSAEVPGGPDELSAKLTEKLARDGLGFLGPIKITSADRTEVSFEALGNAPGAAGLRRGAVRFSAVGNKTRIEYCVDAGSGRVLLALGWVFVAIGLAALLIGLCLEFAFVINSPQAAVRGQAAQMIQAVHFIWPPFLFAQLSRQPIKVIKNQFEALINNLPYA
jgi:hypothetical protein